ncbi:MAG: hypothetical protein IJH12_05295 [Clostridia bacterium]|nr:hypothetical protein [Clostridia bacterium]
MKDATVTVETRSFVCIAEEFKTMVLPAETRTPESVIHSDECVFYFFDSYVGIVDGVEYRFGPEFNVSPKYYCVGKYYPNPEHFRAYHMRCWGWSEKQIAEHENDFAFGEYNETVYPDGVVTVNGVIQNPKGGVILQAKKTIDHDEYPSEETKKMYSQ